MPHHNHPDTFAKIDKLLNRSNLVQFIEAEKCHGPTSQAEKMLMLKLAIEYTINLTNRKDYYIVGCNLLEFLTKEILSKSQNVSF